MKSMARLTAERYVELVNECDLDEVLSLFSDEAVILHPDGVFEGPDAIRRFYQEIAFPEGAQVRVTRWVDSADDCVIELEPAPRPSNGAPHIVDVLTVDDEGYVTRLAVYRR